MLAPGARIGRYEVIARIGAGGMGEVYRAVDASLKRQIALKVLPAAVSSHPEHLARLRREAEVLAALNHPNIAHLYGLEKADGRFALVMELVEGPTLADRLTTGAIPIDEALPIATQIAAALEAAHEQGIVHRDLKPANIKVRDDGTVKVLDFGLAKALDPASGGRVDVSSSPTITTPAAVTGVGVILGTAAYMSPEQARGLPVGRRSDIWAFGCVVYEMLTGVRLFSAETVTDTLAAVITREPDWERVPARARRLLQKCLERDPRRRLRDIGDAMLLLDESPAETATRARTPTLSSALSLATIASLLAALFLMWPAPADRPFVRVAIDLGGTVPESALVPAAVSADGSRLVFHTQDENGRNLLATRLLDESTPTRLAGTEGADQPFFSPDGEWIGFFAGGHLRKVPVQGGTPVPLARAGVPRGASWGDDGKIVAALSNEVGLSVIDAEGGEPRSLTTLSPGEPTHRWPQLLPGATAVIFTANAPTLNSYEDATIDVQSLASGERKTLWRGGYFGRYVPTGRGRGHLVYVRGGVLFVVPFDPVRLEIQGTPARLLDDVAADPGSAAGRFDFSRTGTFVYESGPRLLPWTIGWLDDAGKSRPLLAKPGLYYSPRLAPDGQRLAISIDSGRGSDIYVYDWQRDVLARVTYTEQASADPVWAADGQHLLFRSHGANPALWWVRTDGAGQAVRLLDGLVGDLGPHSLSPDGRRLIYSAPGDGGNDLWTVALDLADVDHPKPGIPEPLVRSPANQGRPAFSPDGRWVAYASSESGSSEIYVRSFSGKGSRADGRWQVSTGGGEQPVWSRMGGKLFFLANDRIMVTEYQTAEGTFVAGKPRLWSALPRVGNIGFSRFDVAPDGNRIATLMRQQADADEQMPRMTLLLNFFDEIRRRSPTN
jgi:Tol biopolymer transport system component